MHFQIHTGNLSLRKLQSGSRNSSERAMWPSSTIQFMPPSLGPPFGFYSRFVCLQSNMATILTFQQVSVEDLDRYAAVMEGTEIIANIITQYRVIEKLDLSMQDTTTIQLKERMTTLYVSILRFLAKAKRFYIGNTASMLLCLCQIRRIVIFYALISSNSTNFCCRKKFDELDRLQDQGSPEPRQNSRTKIGKSRVIH